MLLAAARKVCQVGTRHQIAIEPAAAGYSPFRDFVHCRFADAGRRWVWLRSPTAGIRKPSQRRTRDLRTRHGECTPRTGQDRCSAEDVRRVPHLRASAPQYAAPTCRECERDMRQGAVCFSVQGNGLQPNTLEMASKKPCSESQLVEGLAR